MPIEPEIFPLELPRVLLDAAIRRARAEGVSLQRFISEAIEEKVILFGRSTPSS
jgi:predicted DNA binding CopG/RHH family protein